MGYRIELLVPDETGDKRVCAADERRHSILIHAWSAGMEAARMEAKRRGTPVLLRILDRTGRLAVTGRVDLPPLSSDHLNTAR